MIRQTTAAATFLAVALAPRARAQSASGADSLPARPGSWALEAGVDANTFFGSTANVGALRFLGARSAVALNLFGGHTSQSRDVSGGFGGSDTERSTVFGATLGVRWYAPVRGALAGFGGVGATGAYTYGRFGGSSNTQTRVGGYGEVGAAYLVARRLAVNVSTGLTAVRTGGRSESVGFVGEQPMRTVTRSRGWSTVFGGTRLSATLFF